mmetsp:Transcript_51223/g.124825  ORF Transcript_51223/g.124825 Transcript_51223/m.124825 type:complete len:127 (+) Transcript_51223:1639-2019(+)
MQAPWIVERSEMQPPSGQLNLSSEEMLLLGLLILMRKERILALLRYAVKMCRVWRGAVMMRGGVGELSSRMARSQSKRPKTTLSKILPIVMLPSRRGLQSFLPRSVTRIKHTSRGWREMATGRQRR